MTVAEWCIFASLMLALLSIASVKWFRFGRFDNSKPRDPAFYDDPFRARALGAHQNGLEGFAFFAVAVVVAQMRAAPQHIVDGLALAYVALRFAYAAAYLAGAAPLRSAIWALAFAVNVALLLTPLLRG